MRKLAMCVLMAGIVLPACAARRVTVAELQQAIAEAQGKLDRQTAKQLDSLELTERLSTARLEQLSADLPGEKSRQALRALSDESAFLAPPAAEIPATATPTAAAQRRMMAKTVNYLGKTLPMLPNLFATRATTRFENRPEPTPGAESGDNPMHVAGRSAVTVFYRDGQEFMDTSAESKDKPQALDIGLTTWGEFGPIMGIVVMDAAHSRLVWSHWELSRGGPEAAFYYSVPMEKSHFDLRFCCETQSYGMEVNIIRQRAGYHGEMTVDPATGTILRLTVESDLAAGNPIARAGIVVEYGPQEIGGRTYICPARGIAMAVAPDIKALAKALQPPGAPGAPLSLKRTSMESMVREPQQKLVNDVAFGQYHMLRAEARVVSDKEAEEAANAPAGAAPGTPMPDFANARPAGEVAAENMNAVAASATAPVAAALPGPAEASEAGTVAAGAPEAQPELPEIMVSEAAGLPRAPAVTETSAPGSGFTLRMNARLVDVGVVAVDKKGRPISDLKPEDFEIYDNGVKQEVRSFGQIGVAGPKPPAPTPPPGAPPAFSNHPLNSTAVDANTTILLLDASNLSFADMGNAKGQLRRFLRGLKSDERASLYVMNRHGFKVLEEATTDHDLLDATLTKWRPNVGDVANAQDEEVRNRQQMETVHSPEDLLSVNGNNLITDPQSQQQPLDPQLMDNGANPARDALTTLVTVARHLAAVAGHKSLVWVTSDNVLADWNEGSISIEKNSKFVESFALHAQEAMNNAHVSVYPLDASQLEAGMIDAGIGTRNVELNPTCTECQAPAQAAATVLGPEARSAGDLTTGMIADRNARTMGPGRLAAQMQQDLHSIQGVFREVAEATGGHAFRRAGDIAGELNTVIAEGHATYLLGFSPSQPSDGTYHVLSVKVNGHKDVKLRFRTGYLYDKEPATLKDRFAQAVWQPMDASEIGMTADRVAGAKETTLRLNIAANDVALAQLGDLWADKLDVFLVQRDDTGQHAQVSGQTMRLNLKNETYRKLLREGIPYDQVVGIKQQTSSVRIVVVDENSGRMGSVTVPGAALAAKP